MKDKEKCDKNIFNYSEQTSTIMKKNLSVIQTFSESLLVIIYIMCFQIENDFKQNFVYKKFLFLPTQ